MSNPEWPDTISERVAALNSKVASSELQDYMALAQEVLKGVGGQPASKRAEENSNTPELDAFIVAQIAGKRLAAEQERVLAMQQRQLEQLYQQNKFYQPPPMAVPEELAALSGNNQRSFLSFSDVASAWIWIRASTFALIVLFLSEVSDSAFFIACRANQDPIMGRVRLRDSDEMKWLLETLRGASRAFLVQGMDGVSRERLLSFQEIIAPTKCEPVERQISFDD